MKLRNKKTGEIREARIVNEHLQLWSTDLEEWVDYDDLDYLAKWWERYEEPNLAPDQIFLKGGRVCIDYKSVEAAEEAVKKLEAWERLKDNGCRFILDDHFAVNFVGPDATKITSAEEQKSLSDDYKLLFGGEE